jgi:hypothetical protein
MGLRFPGSSDNETRLQLQLTGSVTTAQSSFLKILWQETTAVQLLFAHFSKSTTVDNVAFVFVPELFCLSVGVPEVVLQTFRYLQLIVKIPGILTYY